MDDEYFYCSGGNESNGKCAFNIKVARKNGSGNSLSGLVGYIHNPFITTNDVTTDYKELYEKEKIENERLKAILGQIKELCG